MASSSLGISSTDAFALGIHPILRILSDDQMQQLIEYQGEKPLRLRIDELASKSNEGTLTPSEQAEYEGYVRANKFVATLQAQARKLIGSKHSR